MTAAELRALAEKATPGEWTTEPEEAQHDMDHSVTSDFLRDEESDGVAYQMSAADAAFVSACSPSAVLALLERIARLESAIGKIGPALDAMNAPLEYPAIDHPSDCAMCKVRKINHGPSSQCDEWYGPADRAKRLYESQIRAREWDVLNAAKAARAAMEDKS